MQTLPERIDKRTARLAVIGLGYVGLPMCYEFVQAGFEVTGIDKDEKRIGQLKEGRSYILDIQDEMVRKMGDHFTATSDFELLRQADVAVICVPTPLRKTKDPDLSYILSATVEIANRLRPGQLIILESTTYPGTTDEIILPQLQSTGL